MIDQSRLSDATLRIDVAPAIAEPWLQIIFALNERLPCQWCYFASAVVCATTPAATLAERRKLIIDGAQPFVWQQSAARRPTIAT
jgi:hypothetical protein